MDRVKCYSSKFLPDGGKFILPPTFSWPLVPLCSNYTTARLKFRVVQFSGSRSRGHKIGTITNRIGIFLSYGANCVEAVRNQFRIFFDDG